MPGSYKAVWVDELRSIAVTLVVVIGVSLSTILSPFKPASMVKTLNKTVEKTYIHYDEHKDILDESTTFEVKVNKYAQNT